MNSSDTIIQFPVRDNVRQEQGTDPPRAISSFAHITLTSLGHIHLLMCANRRELVQVSEVIEEARAWGRYRVYEGVTASITTLETYVVEIAPTQHYLLSSYDYTKWGEEIIRDLINALFGWSIPYTVTRTTEPVPTNVRPLRAP